MSGVQLAIAALAAIALFLHALGGFSRELQRAGGAILRTWLGALTPHPWIGFGVGALTTALLQSSSAVTALAVTLVDAGALSFRASLAVLLGANVGTTTTGWLVALRLTAIGPLFLVAGTALSAVPWRIRVVGQATFYFGLILFALDLIGSTLAPMRDHPVLTHWLAYAEDPLRGALVGMIVTAVVQSSSVTTGLAVLFVQQGVLESHAAIPVVVGANVGTTSTALLASIRTARAARAAAVANFVFNATGVLVLLPWLGRFSRLMVDAVGSTERAVVWAHLLFNVGVAAVFMTLLPRVTRLLEIRFGVTAGVEPSSPPR